MRIRVINPNTTWSMTRLIGECAAAVAPAGVTVEAVSPAVIDPSGAPSDEHIIIAGGKTSCGRKSHDLLEPASYPIAFDRGSNLSGNGEPHTARGLIPPPADLQHEARGRRLDPGRGSEEIGSPPQPLHPGSGAEAFAAMRPAGCDHLAAARGSHAGPEPMAALAHQLARLIGPFHVAVSALCRYDEHAARDVRHGPARLALPLENRAAYREAALFRQLRGRPRVLMSLS